MAKFQRKREIKRPTFYYDDKQFGKIPIYVSVSNSWWNSVDKIAQTFMALRSGLNETETRSFLGVYQNSWQRFLELNSHLKEILATVKTDLVTKAKLNVSKKIASGDLETSKWYLERRAKDEFSPRNETVEAKVNLDEILSFEEKREIAKSILNDQSQDVEKKLDEF
jgi:hypothetical protein